MNIKIDPQSVVITKEFNAAELSKILRMLMAEHGNLSEAQLARDTNLPQPTIHRILNGETQDPRISTITPLAEYFNVSINQLLGLEPLSANLSKSSRVVSIPIISWADVVKGAKYYERLTPENWKSWANVESKHAGCYALKSKPSMSPRFPIHSVLIIDKQTKVFDGDFIVISSQEMQEATLRQYVSDGAQKYLKPITPEFPIEPFNDQIVLHGVLIRAIFDFSR